MIHAMAVQFTKTLPFFQIAIMYYVAECEQGRTAAQSQKAVSAYFTSERILPFGFAEKCTNQPP